MKTDPRELMARITAPRTIDAALQLALVQMLTSPLARYALWWGVVYYATALFVRVERAMVPRPTTSPIRVAGDTVSGLLSSSPSHVGRANLRALSEAVQRAKSPWVVLVGLPGPGDEMTVQREALSRLALACTGFDDADAVRVWALRGDLVLASQGTECPSSPTRTVVFDGEGWRGMIAEVLDVHLDGEELHMRFDDVELDAATPSAPPSRRREEHIETKRDLFVVRGAQRAGLHVAVESSGAPEYVVEAELSPTSWSISGAEDQAHMGTLVVRNCERIARHGEGSLRVTRAGRTELHMRCAGGAWRML